jgi:glycosyltransferase involved in cell wall biosynthesis
VIIEAAMELAQYKEIEFVFVGDRTAHHRLAEERDKRGLENIRFMPFQPIEKLRSVMEGGDIHLVTMREEAQGMLVPCKFYSGLIVGRPTIFAGPQDCEISDVIQTYKCGSVVPPTDGKALAAAIYKYRTNGDAWFEAQEGALAAAHAYHPTQSLNAWVNLLEEINKKT